MKKLRAFAGTRSMFMMIAAVQVAGVVAAPRLIKGGSPQATTSPDGRASGAQRNGADGSTLSASAGGDSRLQPQPVMIEVIGSASPLNTARTDAGPLITRPDHAVSSGGSRALGPAGAALGLQNTFMSVSPDVAAPGTSSAFGLVLANFAPGEPIQFFIGGTLTSSSAADNYGRAGAIISTPSGGEGYVTFEAVGPTSGKRDGGTAYVLTGATAIPGLAVGPHVINGNVSGTIHMVGTRYPANNSITIARNGVALGTVTSDINGRFFVTVPVPAGTDTSAIYTASSVAAGTLNGQTVEERADAGLPPQGDQNASRAYFDRPVLSSSSGATLAWVGEGFQPGETVNVTGCASGSAAADGNGAVSLFVSFGPGAGVAQCVYTGATSGRVARATAQADPNAVNVPAAINAPATLASGGASFRFLFDRLTASQTGAVYIDGVNQGTGTINAAGFGSVVLTASGASGIHSVVSSGHPVRRPLLRCMSSPPARRRLRRQP